MEATQPIEANREVEQIVGREATTIFTEEELNNFLGIKSTGPDYIEIECGCKNVRYGDIVGDLKIFAGGKLEIVCQCSDECQKAKLSPVEFAKHGGRRTTETNWKSQIWVTNSKGHKVCLSRTCLMKFHKETFHRPLRGLTIHRDEFIHCSSCNKARRFLLRTKEQCRIYHDALAIENWKCSDMLVDQITCGDEEERKSRRPCRGCPMLAKCKGCTRCVCFGCFMCRFEDCNCRTCVDFTQHATT